jgi:hypothetical protein
MISANHVPADRAVILGELLLVEQKALVVQIPALDDVAVRTGEKVTIWTHSTRVEVPVSTI